MIKLIRAKSALQIRARSASIPKRLRVNNQIRIPKVQVIDENGKQLGILNTFDALGLAKERDLDLVEVDPNAHPSICKIMDYGKYLYRKERQERKHRAKQRAGEVKGIRISARIGKHDLEFKAKQASKFLKKNYKVKVETILKGRERAFQNLAKEKIQEFLSLIEEPYRIEQELKRMPSGLVMIITRAA